MYKNTALLIASIVFALIALMHALRIIYMVTVIIGTYSVPTWVSVLGFNIALLLSLLMLKARKNHL